MIGFLLAAAIALPTAPPDIPPLPGHPTPSPPLATAALLDRYARALAANPSPRVLTFEYGIEQTGQRNISQTHRVFRSGTSERDELLTSDGKRLSPPVIHVYVGRRDRYAVTSLAPRPEVYSFRYVGSLRDGHHVDEVFATKPSSPSSAHVDQVTIDGITGLPVAIRFVTQAHHGIVIVTYGRVQKYWVPLSAVATATVGTELAVERISFSRYRFPRTLSPATFTRPKPAKRQTS